MSLNVEIIKQTFEKIKPSADEFALSWYRNLFREYPQAAPLIANTNMAERRRNLMASVVEVIENMDNPDLLSDAVKELQIRHRKYSTRLEYYPMMGTALLKTLEEYLGSDWTPEVKLAWSDGYAAITQIILEGI